MKIKKGDKVQVIAGAYKGTVAEVIKVLPKENKVVVEGVNVVKKHVKPRRAGEAGGILESASAVYVSKVMVVCPHCSKPTRIGRKRLADKSAVRVCKRCGDTL